MTSSGPRCSTTSTTGRRSPACGAPARTRRRFQACGSHTPMSGRSSMRSTPARSSLSCRRLIPSPRLIEARNWTYFPPLGRRSAGGGQAFEAAVWGGVPGGYRNTINDNIVLILMIETLEGLKNADEIAKVPGVTARIRGEWRPRQLFRFPTGHARLRTRHQHRPRCGGKGRRAAVWSAGMA